MSCIVNFQCLWMLFTGKSNKILSKWENFAERRNGNFIFDYFTVPSPQHHTHVYFFYDFHVIIMPYNSVGAYVKWNKIWLGNVYENSLRLNPLVYVHKRMSFDMYLLLKLPMKTYRRRRRWWCDDDDRQ